jgi:membrane protease YdiL (CAAX protease family)
VEYLALIANGTSVHPSGAPALWIYLLLLVVAQSAGMLFGATSLALSHAALILVLVNDHQWRTGVPGRDLRLILALLSLACILTALVPCGGRAQLVAYLLVYLVLLVGVGMAARFLCLGRADLGLRADRWKRQALMAASGILLGAVAIAVVPAEFGLPADDWTGAIAPALVFAIVAALSEEILLRGLLLGLAIRALGARGILYSSCLSASLYLGSLSFSYVILILLTSLYFSWFVSRTRTIWGVVIAHSVMNLFLINLWPIG